jgi:hypothetical protein
LKASHVTQLFVGEVSNDVVLAGRYLLIDVDLNFHVIGRIAAGRKGTRARYGVTLEKGRTIIGRGQHGTHVIVRATAEIVDTRYFHFKGSNYFD